MKTNALAQMETYRVDTSFNRPQISRKWCDFDKELLTCVSVLSLFVKW